MADIIESVSWIEGDSGDADLINEQVRSMLRSPFGIGLRRSRPLNSTGQMKIGRWGASNALDRQILKRFKKKGRHQGLTSAEAQLLKMLRSCRRITPCTSAACPKCTLALQGAMAALHVDLRSVGIKLDGCLTIIATQRITEPGAGPKGKNGRSATTSSNVGLIRSFADELPAVLEEAGVTMVIGGVDLDWHEFRDGSDKTHGRPHLHALVWYDQAKAGLREIKAAFPKAKSVDRPVLLEPFDGNDQWVRYALKYPNQRKIRNRDEQGRWLTPSYKKPTVEQQLHQAMVLHEAGWGARLFLKGVQLTEISRGWQLVLTDFRPEPRHPRRRRR